MVSWFKIHIAARLRFRGLVVSANSVLISKFPFSLKSGAELVSTMNLVGLLMTLNSQYTQRQLFCACSTVDFCRNIRETKVTTLHGSPGSFIPFRKALWSCLYDFSARNGEIYSLFGTKKGLYFWRSCYLQQLLIVYKLCRQLVNQKMETFFQLGVRGERYIQTQVGAVLCGEVKRMW